VIPLSQSLYLLSEGDAIYFMLIMLFDYCNPTLCEIAATLSGFLLDVEIVDDFNKSTGC